MDDYKGFNLILKNALNYYDKNTHLYNSYFRNKNYKYETPTIENIRYIIIKNEDDKIVFKSKYEWIGLITYDEKNKISIWQWAWGIPWLTKKSLSIAIELFKYATNLDIKRDNKLLKSLLLKTNTKIINNMHLDIYKAIISYYTKSPYIVIEKYIKDEDDDLIDEPNYDYHAVLILIEPEEFEN